MQLLSAKKHLARQLQEKQPPSAGWRTPARLAFLQSMGRLVFSHAFRKKLKKCFENYLHARIIMLEGCCGTWSLPLRFLTTLLCFSLWDAQGIITLLERVSAPGLHCSTACWSIARCFVRPRSLVPRLDQLSASGDGKRMEKIKCRPWMDGVEPPAVLAAV